MSKFLVLLIEHVLTVCFAIVTTVYISKVYGPANTGNLGVVLSVCSFLSFLFVLGMDNVIHRLLASDASLKRLFELVMYMKIIGLLIYSLIAIPALLFLIKEDKYYVISLFVAVTFSLFFGNSSFLRIFMVHYKRANVVAISAIISRALGISFVLFAVINEYPYHYVIMYMLIFGLVSNLIYYYIFRTELRNSMTLDAPNSLDLSCKSIFHQSKNIFVASIFFNSFIYLDSLILYLMTSSNSKSVGIYVTAQKIIFTFSFVGGVVSNFFTRKFYSQYEKNGIFPIRCFTAMVRIQLTFALILIVCVSMIALPFELFMGKEFNGISLTLIICSFSWLFIFPATSFSKSLILLNRTDLEIKKGILVAVLNVLLNLIFIPIYGIYAVAVVMVLSYFIADFAIYGFFNKTNILYGMYLRSIGDILNIRRTIHHAKRYS